jgi:hypothetical protein
MPGWRPWKVECVYGSTASDVAVVVVSLFGHVDGVERTVGDKGMTPRVLDIGLPAIAQEQEGRSKPKKPKTS